MAKLEANKQTTGTGAPARTAKNPIACGVIGLGRIGWSHHAQTILQHPGFTLAAVCDPEPDRQAQAHEASGCATYADYTEMLRDDSVELVVVASQTVDHEPMTLAALKAGKHVLCEKPAAQSAAGVRRMARAAERAGRLLIVHHNYRVAAEFLYVSEIIKSGVLGKVFRIKRSHQSFSRRNDWQVLRKYGGGMVGNWGVHLVDACLCLLDSPVRDVWGEVKQVFNPGDAEDDVKAVIRGTSGMTLDIDLTSACAAPEPNWAVLGNRGTLWIQDGKAFLQFFDPKQLPRLQVNDGHLAPGRRYGVVAKDEDAGQIPWQHREEEPVPTKKYPGFYDNLHDAVRKGKPLLVTPESALRTYQVLDQIRKGGPFEVGT